VDSEESSGGRLTEDFIEEIFFDQYRFDIWDKAPTDARRLGLFRGIGYNDKVPLQAGDLKVLEQLLCPRTKKLVTRENIVARLWGGESRGTDNVDTHISALRTELNDRAAPHKLIETVRGKGFVFLLEVTRKKRPVIKAVPPRIVDSSEDQTQEAFDEFFGVRAAGIDGVIILQSDLIDDSLLPGSGQLRGYAQPDSRFYKARTVLNTCDTYGATLIQEAFQKRQRKAPKLIFSDHNTKDTTHSAPFKISMGLGFTDQTTRTIQDRTCGSWMRISHTGGDALSLRECLLPGKGIKARLGWEPDVEKPGFFRLVPSDWDSNYVQAWSQMLPPANGPDVRDYALIFRNTRRDGGRQILLAVAGFTERSTALGGKFLAEKWPKLWEDHVRGSAFSGSLGDFLILIEGPSDPDRLDEWSEVKEFEWSPEKLKAIREKLKAKGEDVEWACEWADRDLEKSKD
jgi:DNA-binding winged helix-turn-helix (wHTH) protein